MRQTVSREGASATAFLELAAALAEIGEEREAAEVFRRGYLKHPTIYPLLNEGQVPSREIAVSIRDYAVSLIRNGVAYSPIVASNAIAEAFLDNRSEVRRLVDYDRFFWNGEIEPPEGRDRREFNRALAAEIKSELKFYDEPQSKAIRKAWRHNQVLQRGLPNISLWECMIRARIDRYMASVRGGPEHPFPRAMPVGYALEAWALVSNGESFHRPHIHSRAWMSGVYYVACPAISLAPGSRVGWLRVGGPSMHGISARQGWEERFVSPEPGNAVMMPAYFFHWTEPSRSDDERICIVFDVVPAELAGAGRDAGDERDE